MTEETRANTRITGTLQSVDGRGIVRMEGRYDTDIDDLWSALTETQRLARWIAEVEGDLRVGGAFRATFTSGWEGPGRVDVCDPPRHLLVTMTPGGEDETSSRPRSSPTATRQHWWSRSVGSPFKNSPRTEPAGRRISKTSSPIVRDESPRTGTRAGPSSHPRIESRPSTKPCAHRHQRRRRRRRDRADRNDRRPADASVEVPASAS